MTSRSGRRFCFAVLATAVVVGTTSCSSAGSTEATPSTSAAPSSEAGSGTYLALGDSVPFGFRGGAPSAFSDAKNFVGYPELVAEDLGLDVLNASCPGETAASFVDASAQSNGCENAPNSTVGYRSHFPLHVDYDAPDQSQLDYALQTLKETDDIQLVTLQIGANDGFLCQQTTPSRCTATADIQDLVNSVGANLDRILKTLRAQYDGELVVVTYYALNYADPMGVAIEGLDSRIAEIGARYGAEIADGYAAFQPAATAAGGSSVDAGLVLPNDVHPTEQGQRLLADAVKALVG